MRLVTIRYNSVQLDYHSRFIKPIGLPFALSRANWASIRNNSGQMATAMKQDARERFMGRIAKCAGVLLVESDVPRAEMAWAEERLFQANLLG